jgi:hypothetical protein
MLTLQHLAFNPIGHGYPQQQLFAFAGRSSVSPLPDSVLGVGAFWMPPISGQNFGCRFKLRLPDFDLSIGDSGLKEHYAPPQLLLQSIDYLPWAITRTGLFNRDIAGQHIIIQAASTLTPAADADALIVKIDLTLRSSSTLKLEVAPELTHPADAFGPVVSSAWNYEPPSSQGIIWSEGPKRWRTDEYVLSFDCHAPKTAQSPTPSGWAFTLKKDKTITLWMTINFQGTGLTPLTRSPESHAQSAHQWWQDRFTTFTDKFSAPLEKLPPKQKLLAARSWATLMTTRWSRPNFIADPYYATSGIDGGSLCSYLWDHAYTSKITSALEGYALRPLIERYLAITPERFFTGYSVSPIGDHWLGVFYAFNPYALTQILSDYITHTNDTSLLTATINGSVVLDRLESILAQFETRFAGRDGLLDFGHNRHLIELLTAGYEGLVPNPTLEHAWTLRQVNHLRAAAGLKPNPAYEKRAKHLIKACTTHFWNEKAGWFFPADQRDSAGTWSIQVLSALRLGVFTPKQVSRMAAHLIDGEFLAPHGLYSISRHDQHHFTLTDVDWGGAGCYAGHVGIVLEGLLKYNQHETAQRLLSRIDWWADAMPYIPQNARADSRFGHPGRPNITAAGAIAQALLM